MAEEKMKSALDKIEQLILDGNKEVVRQVEKKIEETKQELQQEFRQELDGTKQGIQWEIRQEAGKLDNKLDLYYKMLDYDVKEVDKKVGEVKRTLDEHVRLPAHA